MKATLSVIVFAAMLSVAATFTHAQQPQKIGDGFFKGWYSSTFVASSVQHPRKISVVWRPDTKVEFILPPESDRSGVANILFRDRDSGRIRLLDTIKVNPSYGEVRNVGRGIPEIDTIKYIRHSNHLIAGNYDVILLYNNGKYVVYEDVSLVKGAEQIIDMTAIAAMPADFYSRQWLTIRKFTDIVGARTLLKWYNMSSPDRVAGYIFNHGGRPLHRTGAINDYEREMYVSPSIDGYFEMDLDRGDASRTLDFVSLGRPNPFSMELGAGTWLFIVWEADTRDFGEQIAGTVRR